MHGQLTSLMTNVYGLDRLNHEVIFVHGYPAAVLYDGVLFVASDLPLDRTIVDWAFDAVRARRVVDHQATTSLNYIRLALTQTGDYFNVFRDEARALKNPAKLYLVIGALGTKRIVIMWPLNDGREVLGAVVPVTDSEAGAIEKAQRVARESGHSTDGSVTIAYAYEVPVFCPFCGADSPVRFYAGHCKECHRLVVETHDNINAYTYTEEARTARGG